LTNQRIVALIKRISPLVALGITLSLVPLLPLLAVQQLATRLAAGELGLPTEAHLLHQRRYMGRFTAQMGIVLKCKFFCSTSTYICIYYSTLRYIVYIIEGSLEVKLPTIWRDEKQSREAA
jgi:hypothetical protein